MMRPYMVRKDGGICVEGFTSNSPVITRFPVLCCCSATDAADDNCYETFNTAGRFNGHCGPNGTSGGYLRCAAEYVVCVRLFHRHWTLQSSRTDCSI